MLTFQELLTAVPLVLRGGNVPNIVGEAGIGKSALVEEVARQMGATLFTTVVSLSEKGDLAIPVPPLTAESYVETENYGELADVKYGYTHTLIEIIQAAETHPGQPIIWFLDEFNRGSQAVQSELMNLVLQRQINSLRLPREVRLVIAENPDESMAGFEGADYGVVAGDAAIKDRTVRLVMGVDAASWLAWAAKEDSKRERPNIHELVQQYLTEDATQLYPAERGDDLNPTPRAWQRVSDNLFELLALNATLQESLMFDLVAGDLGEAAAQRFVQFLQSHQESLTPTDIFVSEPFGADVPESVLARYSALPEVQKLTALKSSVAQIDLTMPDNASRFAQIMQATAKDGQYAMVKQLANGDLLEKLYKSTDDHVRGLYELITKVAAYDVNGD
jgi:MoxR-like ATPase